MVGGGEQIDNVAFKLVLEPASERKCEDTPPVQCPLSVEGFENGAFGGRRGRFHSRMMMGKIGLSTGVNGMVGFVVYMGLSLFFLLFGFCCLRCEINTRTCLAKKFLKRY